MSGEIYLRASLPDVPLNQRKSMGVPGTVVTGAVSNVSAVGLCLASVADQDCHVNVPGASQQRFMWCTRGMPGSAVDSSPTRQVHWL